MFRIKFASRIRKLALYDTFSLLPIVSAMDHARKQRLQRQQLEEEPGGLRPQLEQEPGG